MNTLGSLRSTIEALIAAHGPDAEVDFLFQYGSGRTSFDYVTGYTVYASHDRPHVRFKIGYARGKDAATANDA